MPTIDPRIDAYIAAAPAFSQPILNYLRETIHAACPDVVETMKWSRPHFEHNGLLCGMSAFKAHCAFGFWKGALMFPHSAESDGMNHFGRITSVADLPSQKELMAHVRTAVKLNAEGSAPARVKAVKPPLEVPAFFRRRWRRMRRGRKPSMPAARVSSASMSSGSPRPRPRRRARSGWRRRWSGWRRGRQGTGNMGSVDLKSIGDWHALARRLSPLDLQPQ